MDLHIMEPSMNFFDLMDQHNMESSLKIYQVPQQTIGRAIRLHSHDINVLSRDFEGIQLNNDRAIPIDQTLGIADNTSIKYHIQEILNEIDEIDKSLIAQPFSEYGDYSTPHYILTIQNIESLKKLIQEFIDDNTKKKIILPCHHPYYRKLLKDYMKPNKSIKFKSIVDVTLPKNEDSMLLYHFKCKKCTPVCKVRWHVDYYKLGGAIAQLYAWCRHCDDKMITSYKDDPEFSSFGYNYVRGKNAILVQKQ